MQAGSALEGWESMDDMEDYQEASSQVDGVPPSLYLLADPTIPVHLPDTQVYTTLFARSHQLLLRDTWLTTKQTSQPSIS